MIQRGEELIIPNGNTVFAPGDTIVIKLVDDKIAFEKKQKRAKKEQNETSEVV